MTPNPPPLFTPIEVRGMRARNRIVISPMQQYMGSRDGLPTDWHLPHLIKFAVGGAGLVFTEALAIEARGKATWSDLGIWNDAQLEALKPIAEAISAQGAIAGAQLIHAGRKGSVQRPWEGYQSLSDADTARGDPPWPTIGPSALPANPGWQTPIAMTLDDIARVIEAFGVGARRVAKAGFQALNIHGAHGYLIHSFLSPISNRRDDKYGGDLTGRMRFALEVAEAVRAETPGDHPIFYRLSCIDDLPDGWTLDDTLVLATELGRRGIDVIDCSSRGLGPRGTLATATQAEGFQVPFANAVRRDTGIRTMAVGLIRHASFANDVIANGRADFVAIAREALFDPHWPLHAGLELGHDLQYQNWPPSYGWWLARRAQTAPAVK